MRSICVLIFSFLLQWQPHFRWPENAVANELMLMRLLHIIFGIIWIGLLYFFNFVKFPMMRALEAGVRVKVYPELMSRAMAWFRWSAVVTFLMGISYFFRLLATDARNAGNPRLAWSWFGWWWVVWLVAYALIYALQLPMKGPLNNGWIRAMGIA